MFTRNTLIMGCAVAILATPALAESTAKPATPADDGDKLVCTSEQATGTRFRKKICMTKAQRAAIAERDRANLNEIQMRSPLNADSGGGR